MEGQYPVRTQAERFPWYLFFLVFIKDAKIIKCSVWFVCDLFKILDNLDNISAALIPQPIARFPYLSFYLYINANIIGKLLFAGV